MTHAEISKFGDIWTRENNAGHGYAPYTDVAGDDTVDAAVEAAEADGWDLVGEEPGSIKILRNGDGEYMGIGGDGSGKGAWACDLGKDD